MPDGDWIVWNDDGVVRDETGRELDDLNEEAAKKWVDELQAQHLDVYAEDSQSGKVYEGKR